MYVQDPRDVHFGLARGAGQSRRVEGGPGGVASGGRCPWAAAHLAPPPGPRARRFRSPWPTPFLASVPSPLLRFSPAPPVAAPGAAAPAASSGRQLSGSRARHGSRAEVGAGRGVGGGGCWEWPGWGGGCAAAAATTVVSIDLHAPLRRFGRSRPPHGTTFILRSSIPRRAPGGAACGSMAAKARPCQSELDESGLDGAHAGRRGDQQRP